MEYTFADGSYVKGVSAQVAGERLSELQQSHPTLSPKLIVEDARPEDAVLHPAFTWDDEKAAELHREWEARNLIKSIRVVETDAQDGEPHRAFINVITLESRGYMNSATVMSSDVLREQVLDHAKADLRSWRSRYRDLHELAELFAVVDSVLQSDAPAPEAMAAKG
jgi:hypothetical protein